MPELTLDAHEIRSEGRYEHLKHLITHKADNTMSEKDHVKVENIFKGAGHGTEGGLASALPLLLAGGARHGADGFGGAGGLVAGGLGGLVLGSLLNGRNGGLLGGGNDAGNVVAEVATLTGIGDIKAAIALTAAQTENVVAAQTATVQATLGNLALGQQTAIAQVKDTVNNGTLLNLQATNAASDRATNQSAALAAQIAAGFNETQALINSINTQNISRELSDTKAALIEARSDHRLESAGITITNTNNATAVAIAAQSQNQQQLQALIELGAQVRNLANDVQVVRQGQVILNSGTMTASGTQAAANTKVN